MRPLSNATRIGCGDKPSFKDRFDSGTDRVVHDPVAERCRADRPLLRILHDEYPIRSGSIGPITQFAGQAGQIVFEVSLKDKYGSRVSSPSRRTAIGCKKRFKRGNTLYGYWIGGMGHRSKIKEAHLPRRTSTGEPSRRDKGHVFLRPREMRKNEDEDQ
jgi:hypothetical protein